MSKPKILCIVAESGAGKTLVAEYIQDTYGIKMIESWTDRPKRFENEPGHSWATKEQFDQFKEEDMIAFTKFGDYRYCCLKQDVKENNTYVIDEVGLRYLKKHFCGMYDITSVRIIRNQDLREKQIAKERVARDKSMFTMPKRSFDYVIINNSDIAALKYQVDVLVKEVFYGITEVF